MNMCLRTEMMTLDDHRNTQDLLISKAFGKRVGVMTETGHSTVVLTHRNKWQIQFHLEDIWPKKY